MRLIKIITTGFLVSFFMTVADAATIGTFDGPRTGNSYSTASLNVGTFGTAVLRSDVIAAGHTITSTGTINAGFLTGIDVFYSNLLDVFNPTFSYQAGESNLLYDWVFAGGTVFYQGEHSLWAGVTDTFLSPFGITQTENSADGTYLNDPTNPLLAGIAGGLYQVEGAGTVTGNGVVALASSGGNAFAFSKSIGLGQVVGIMDSSQYYDQIHRKFVLNAFDSAGISAVPVPAALPLFGTGVVLLGFLGWRKKRRAKLYFYL